MSEQRNRERRLRRQARRQGLILFKSCSRTPTHPDYGTYCLVDEYTGRLEYGDANKAHGYGMTLDQIENVLNERPSLLASCNPVWVA